MSALSGGTHGRPALLAAVSGGSLAPFATVLGCMVFMLMFTRQIGRCGFTRVSSTSKASHNHAMSDCRTPLTDEAGEREGSLIDCSCA